MENEIQQYENSKSEGFLGSMFRGKTQEEKNKDKKDIAKFRRKKEKEFNEKYAEEENKQQLDDLMNNKTVFDAYDLKKMPEDYIQFIFNVTINQLVIILLDEDSTIDQEIPIAKLTQNRISASTKIGQDFQDIRAGIGSIFIRDFVVKSDLYPYLIETVFEEDNADNAIDLEFNNHPKFDGGTMRLSLITNAKLCFFMNPKLLREIQEFSDLGDKPDEKIDLSYYTEIARDNAIEYINIGADYIEKASEEQKQVAFSSIYLSFDVKAPLIFIPQDLEKIQRTKTVVLDIGRIVANSTNVEYDHKKDYKLERDPELLYDKYKLRFSGLQMSMIEEMTNFNMWKEAKSKIDIIERVKFDIVANKNIEPKHPVFAGLEVTVNIYDINLIFSDYILKNLVKIQMRVLEPFDPESYKANFKN